MNRRLKIALIILLIILVSMISFVGIFVQDTKFMRNILPEYQLGMDLAGYRAISIAVNDGTETIYYDKDGNEVDTEAEDGTSEEVPVNSEDVLTQENYLNTKKIIQDRLVDLGITEYLIRLNENDGTLTVQIPEDDMTDTASQFLYTRGVFTIEDEDGNVLMDNSNLERVQVGYGEANSSTTAGTTVYTNFIFNEDSIEKFKEITTTYVESTDEEGNDTSKEITLNIDGSPLITTSFSEEISNGARSIIDTGIFEKYHVKGIFGLHMFPDLEEGKIGCRKGPLMAQSGELDVVIHGKSAHAGKYQEGIDTIVIASQLITQYQSIVSRMTSPMQPAVIHIGKIQGGTVRNIVAEKTAFHGTVRTYDEKLFNRIVAAMKGYHQGMEKAYGCQIDFSCQTFNPPVINDKGLYLQMVSLLKDDFEELEEPVMLAEDFSHYQKVIPGVFFFIGTKCSEYHSGLHTPTFQFHEKVLLKAVDLYYQLACSIELGEE